MLSPCLGMLRRDRSAGASLRVNAKRVYRVMRVHDLLLAFMPKHDAATAARKLAVAFEHYNEQRPHSALKYRSPRECRRTTDSSSQV